MLMVVTILIFFGVGSNIWIVRYARDRVIDDAALLPDYETALVLGTSNRMRGGKPNPFFNNRMDKAAQLYRLKKVSKFIVSGDNRLATYNEPEMMQNALVARGVPDSEIILDGEGFRTFDSILRSKEIFKCRSIIIITQPFHAYRAIFISDQLGIPAVAFAAREPGEGSGMQVYLREYFARTLAVMDIFWHHLRK